MNEEGFFDFGFQNSGYLRLVSLDYSLHKRAFPALRDYAHVFALLRGDHQFAGRRAMINLQAHARGATWKVGEDDKSFSFFQFSSSSLRSFYNSSSSVFLFLAVFFPSYFPAKDSTSRIPFISWFFLPVRDHACWRVQEYNLNLRREFC